MSSSVVRPLAGLATVVVLAAIATTVPSPARTRTVFGFIGPSLTRTG